MVQQVGARKMQQHDVERGNKAESVKRGDILHREGKFKFFLKGLPEIF
jgi:hypothetical protein